VITGSILANTFLERAFDEEIEISPMKLQKILYFTCLEYLRFTETLLFTEPFEAWRYGPVLPSAYAEFSSYGKNGITRFARDSQGKVFLVNESANPQLKEAINRVWEGCKRLTAIELSQLTHREGTGWDRATKKKELVITMEDMQREIIDGPKESWQY